MHVAQRDAGVEGGGDEAWRRVCGEIRLVIPARRASRFTVRSAACRSIRRPSAPRKIGPVARSPMAEIDALGRCAARVGW